MIGYCGWVAAVFGVVLWMSWSFVLGPRQILGEAIDLVKRQNSSDVEHIQSANSRGLIKLNHPGLGWGGDVFPGLSLVTFSYTQSGEQQSPQDEPHRLAIWWAVDPVERRAKAVESVGDFADKYLISVLFQYLGIETKSSKS